MGTVDETAATFGKLGGTGVAVHVDHAQDTLEMSTQESGEIHPWKLTFGRQRMEGLDDDFPFQTRDVQAPC